MLQWLVSSGDRPKLDPPVGIGSSDQEDDPGHVVSLGKIRSRRRRRVRAKIHLTPTRSSTAVSEVGSDDDEHSFYPVRGRFNFDEDDASNNLYDDCGSMLLEAVMNPNSHRFSKNAQAQPWKQRLLSSKPNIDPEGSSPRKKLLKRMKGLVDPDAGSNKIDPLPAEGSMRGSDFDDQVLQETMKMVTENRSLKHHSNLQRILRESDPSEIPVTPTRRRSPSKSLQRRKASRKGFAEEWAAEFSDDTPMKQRMDYVIDSDNSILQSRAGSDIDSSDVSMFETLQRAMQVQRAGRPSPPASPLPPTGRLFGRGPEEVYGAVQSTLDGDLQDDVVIKSRTPKSNRYRNCPTPEKLRSPLTNPKGHRPQPDTSPLPRKRRSGPRRQVRSVNAGRASASDDSSLDGDDKYAISWNKKQRVASPTHSHAGHTISAHPRSNVKVKSTEPEHEYNEKEPSKADIQARRKTGLRVSSLVDDSSAFGTTDDEGYTNFAGRKMPRRQVSPRASYGHSSHGVEAGRGPEDAGVPSPVQSIDDHELDILSLLSGDCGGRAEERGMSSMERGWQHEKRGVDKTSHSRTNGAQRWSVFQSRDSSGISAGLRDESRMSPLLVPQRKKSFRPPKPEKRKGRDCNPDLNIVDPHLARESATARNVHLGDFEVQSTFGVHTKPCKKEETSHSISLPLSRERQRQIQPPAPERQKARACHSEQDDTPPFTIHMGAIPRKERSAMQSSSHSALHHDDPAINVEHPGESEPNALFANPWESIVPGTRGNPILIGEELISLKTKCRKDTTVDSPCEYVNEACAFIANPHGGSVIRHHVPPGSRQNPIVITDANAAIHDARGCEKSLLRGSIEVNRIRKVDALSRLHPPECTASDAESDRENQTFRRSTGHAKEVRLARLAEPKPRYRTTDVTSNGVDYHAEYPTHDSDECFRSREEVHTCDPPSTMKSLGAAGVSNQLPVTTTNNRNPKDWRPADDDCGVGDCGMNLGLLDNAGSGNSSLAIKLSPKDDAALKILQTELDGHLAGANGIVLFKPNITIYPGSREKLTEPSAQASCVGGSTGSTAIRESLDHVSLTIARLEEKARQVDLVLSSALDQVNRAISHPTVALDMEDDDEMTTEICRLSASEKELWEKLRTSQKSFVDASVPVNASILRDQVAETTEAPLSRQLSPCLVQGLAPMHTERRLSDHGEIVSSLRLGNHGVSPLLPVDLTDVGDAGSVSSSNESVSRSSVENNGLAPSDAPKEKPGYLYDAIPPLRRLRDQARTNHVNTKTRVSSILHLVDPHIDDDDAPVERKSTSCDREVNSSVVVLHHRSQEDVEVMCLPGKKERSLEEPTEEIEVVFVEESFLSTDSFSFGETKGVYFDWKRNPEVYTSEGSTEKLQSVNVTACNLKVQGERLVQQAPLRREQTYGDQMNEVWRRKAVQDMTAGLSRVVGQSPPDRISSGHVQPGDVKNGNHTSTPSGAPPPQRVTFDPPGVDRRALQHERVASPPSRVVRCSEDIRGLEVSLPATRSGGFSDVFSGIDDSVRQVPRIGDDKSTNDNLDDDFKRRVENITRRSERSKQTNVRVLETAPDTRLRADEQSQASSSMMDDEEEDESISLTLSIATKDSITSNTSLASIASADAEAKLKALLSRGKSLIAARGRSMAVSASHFTDYQRLERRQKQSDLNGQTKVTEDRAAPVSIRETSSGEESDWASSCAMRVSEVEHVNSQPVQLEAEIKHVKIPKAACQVEGKPPLAACPASRRLARLRRLQDNWTISKNGYVVPKQRATTSPVLEPTPKGRYRCAQRRFPKVNALSSIGEESCSTLTPSVRRHSDSATRYMPAIRMSRLLARETSSSPTAAATPIHRESGTQLDKASRDPAVPAKPTKRKSLLGQLHLSRVLSKTMRKFSPTSKAKSPQHADARVESGKPPSPVTVPAASRLFQETKRTSLVHKTAGDEPLATSCATETPRPAFANNPFEDLSFRKPVCGSEAFLPPRRKLHLSKIPDFPDLLHPSLRSVVSYPPMSECNDATTWIHSAKSTSPRSLKGLLPTHVRARNVTSALPGSLLWEATHESSDDEP